MSAHHAIPSAEAIADAQPRTLDMGQGERNKAVYSGKAHPFSEKDRAVMAPLCPSNFATFCGATQRSNTQGPVAVTACNQVRACASIGPLADMKAYKYRFDLCVGSV